MEGGFWACFFFFSSTFVKKKNYVCRSGHWQRQGQPAPSVPHPRLQLGRQDEERPAALCGKSAHIPTHTGSLALC